MALKLAVDAAKPPIIRSYSLSEMPHADHLRISVKLEADGAGSAFLHGRTRQGDVLEVSAPRGLFTLRPGDDPAVLMSAGVGATPVLSMLQSLAATNSRRDVWWIYGARNSAEHPFAEETRSLIKQLPRGRSCILYSRPAATDQLGVNFDAQGHIDLALLEKLGVPRNSDFYLCGPSSFLQALLHQLEVWAISSERVHTEIFGALGDITPGVAAATHMPHAPAGAPGVGPTVSFSRSGVTTTWDPKYQSLLELAEACDIPTRWSCRTGVCHTCITGVIAGSVTYSPEPLERPSSGNVLVCCAQPDTNVTLDL